MSLNVKHQRKFSKLKCLSEDLFITRVDIICKPLLAACNVFKKFYHKDNCDNSPKGCKWNDLKILCDRFFTALFINLLSSLLFLTVMANCGSNKT